MSTQPVLPAGVGRAMDVETSWEREYWARHFHISENELLRIVRNVGPDADAVLRFLHEQSRTTPR
jgi:hypothetical protein